MASSEPVTPRYWSWLSDCEDLDTSVWEEFRRKAEGFNLTPQAFLAAPNTQRELLQGIPNADQAIFWRELRRRISNTVTVETTDGKACQTIPITPDMTARKLWETILDIPNFMGCRVEFRDENLAEDDSPLASLGIVNGSRILATSLVLGGGVLEASVSRASNFVSVPDRRKHAHTSLPLEDRRNGRSQLQAGHPNSAEPYFGDEFPRATALREDSARQPANDLFDMDDQKDEIICENYRGNAFEMLLPWMEQLKRANPRNFDIKIEFESPRVLSNRLTPHKFRVDKRRLVLFVEPGIEWGPAMFYLKIKDAEILSGRQLVHVELCSCGRLQVRLEEDLRDFIYGGRYDECHKRAGKRAILDWAMQLCEDRGMSLLAAFTSTQCRFGPRFCHFFKDFDHFCQVFCADCPTVSPRRIMCDIDKACKMCDGLLNLARNERSLAGCLISGENLLKFRAGYDEGDSMEEDILDVCKKCTRDDINALVLIALPFNPEFVYFIRNDTCVRVRDVEVRRFLFGCCQAVQGSVVDGGWIVLGLNFFDNRLLYGVHVTDSESGFLEITHISDLFSVLLN